MEASFEYEGVQFRLESPDGDHIGRVHQAKKTFYELPLLEAIRVRLRQRGRMPGVIVDAGAHVGNHSVYFGAVLERDVLAFEPNPAIFPLLVSNIGHAELRGRVRPMECAVAKYAGWAVLAPPRPGSQNNSGMQSLMPSISPNPNCGPDAPIEAVCVELDAFVSSTHVDLIKLDIEGYEPYALAGAQNTIEESRPLIAMEAATREDLERQRDALRRFTRYRVVDGPFGDTPVYLWEYRDR